MATSQGSKPAACSAAAISRSPLLPSSRSTATRGRSPRARASAGVHAGAHGSAQVGAVRVASPACSTATHSGAACGHTRRACHAVEHNI